MSMNKCPLCDKIYDTDYQMEVDANGDCICDDCYYDKLRERTKTLDRNKIKEIIASIALGYLSGQQEERIADAIIEAIVGKELK